MNVLRSLIVAAILAPLSLAAQPETRPRDEATETFVRGFVRFLAYHEAGHLLMGQIAGLSNNPDWSSADREDYADKFAMILLEPDADDPNGIEEIISAAGGWLQVDNSLIRNDPHAPPHQRAQDIVCLMYGSNPSAFAEFADLVDPDTDCAALYQAMENEIDEVFRDYSGQYGRSIEIIYAAPTGGMEDARQFLRDSGVVEDLKDDIEAEFYLTNRTTIRAMSCEGKAKSDTFYSDTVRSANPEDDHFIITLCYEMIDARLKYGMRGFE
jgi:hypothetical protein